MASPQNLQALGMAHFLAARVGINIQSIVAAGATAAAAAQIPGKPGIYFVNSGASGVVLPKVGGDTISSGILLADEVAIANMSGSALVIFAANNDLGSAVTFFGRGLSTAGTTGISIGTGITAYFKPVTVSTWIFEASI